MFIMAAVIFYSAYSKYNNRKTIMLAYILKRNQMGIESLLADTLAYNLTFPQHTCSVSVLFVGDVSSSGGGILRTEVLSGYVT